jgi:EAL domain-containing protein (putative c-di-GMP-specific phosphodiesterase class I)
LSYVHELPVDVIKIDRSFVNDLGVEDQRIDAIANSQLQLAHNVGATCVAEGVENLDPSDILAGNGWALAPGLPLRPIRAGPGSVTSSSNS